MNKLFYVLQVAVLITVLVSCRNSEEQVHNSLSEAEHAAGWELLFNGENLDGWHLYNKGDIPSSWEVKEGMLWCNPKAKDVQHGDLTTDREFGNFDLTYEWKIGKAGNSGVLVNVQELPEHGATYMTGPEMQLLDNENAEERHRSNPTHLAGSLYELIGDEASSQPAPAGEWNSSRIRQEDGKLSFWLNGNLTAEVDLGSQQWRDTVANSNFRNWDSFGRYKKGKLALQDHGDDVFFRNMKIKALN